jgi:hypothetical protein
VILPFLIFWVLLFLCRRGLGWRWSLLLVAIWAALAFGCFHLGYSPHVFVAVQAVLDAILILVIFKGDIRIN